MANITVLITSSPFGNNIHALAQRYINAAVEHHTIDRIFFYQDAVLVANQAQQPPQGQVSILSQWKSLAECNNIPLQACNGILLHSARDFHCESIETCP